MPRQARLAGAVLGLVTFVAYLPGLGRSLDYDSAETVGLFIRPGPPWAAFRDQLVFNNHPMFSFLEQLVRVATGRVDPATLRLLPIAFGAVTVGVLAWFAARRQGLVAGVVAGAVLASNPTFVDLSRSVRGYSLLTLCALVSTILVVEDRTSRPGRMDLAYVAVAGIGLATHLFMVPVIAAHLAVVVVGKRLDGHWRLRFIGTLLVGAMAYAGMAVAMIEASGAHERVLQPGLPLRIAAMATGGSWASAFMGPLVVVGGLRVLRRSRRARAGGIALVVTLGGLWAGMQSSALDERFFVWLVPAAAYAVAVAVARYRTASWIALGSVVLALSTVAPRYTGDPTAYHQAARVLQDAAAHGRRGCVVGVGAVAMAGYLDTPEDFEAISEPADLDRCDVVVVAAWWPTTAAWFAGDARVIEAAERRFAQRQVLEAGDPALVLSGRF